MDRNKGLSTQPLTRTELTAEDLIGAQKRAYDAHNQGGKVPSFTLQEVNDHDLQAIGSHAAWNGGVEAQMSGDRGEIYASIRTNYGTVTGDEDVPENTLRVWTREKNSDTFYDYTIRRDRAISDAVAAKLRPISANEREKADLIDALERAVFLMQQHGPTTQGALKSRELSTAITYAETALMWLDKVPLPD